MSSMTEEDQPPLVELIQPLTAKDRCQKKDCNAQARFAVLWNPTNDNPLTFCKHHADGLEASFATAFAIRDERPNLVAEEMRRIG